MPEKRKRQRKGAGVDAPVFCEVTLSVLGYPEEGEWVALALEMDLRGYGATFEKALSDLDDLVDMQIGFAISKGQPELIFKPAEPVYWKLYEQGKTNHLESLVRGAGDSGDLIVGGLQIPPAHVIDSLKSDFYEAGG